MMAGNSNWWSMNNMRSPSQQPSTFLSSPTSLFPPLAPGSSSLPFNSSLPDNQDLPQSWSQLLLSGLGSEEDKFGVSHFQSKKLENWEDQILNPSLRVPVLDVKQEVSQSGNLYGHGDEQFHASGPAAWSQIMPVSSPASCVTSLSSNILDFSHNRSQHPDHSSECNSTPTGGVHL